MRDFIGKRDKTRIALQRRLEDLPRDTEGALVECIKKGSVAQLSAKTLVSV
jgi:hypothetical protein